MDRVLGRGRRPDRDQPPTRIEPAEVASAPAPGEASSPSSPATASQAEAADRARGDEAAADAARRWYRAHGIPALQPDERIAPMLGPGEALYAVHPAATLDPRQPSPVTAQVGDLYVTSARVIQAGPSTVALCMGDIREVVLSGDRLLLMSGDGTWVTVTVEQPRLLRVQLAVARAACRRAGSGESAGVADGR